MQLGWLIKSITNSNSSEKQSKSNSQSQMVISMQLNLFCYQIVASQQQTLDQTNIMSKVLCEINLIGIRKYQKGYRMIERFKSLFSKKQPAQKHVQLMRLESLPSRPLEQIEQFINRNFRSIPSSQLNEQFDHLMTKLQSQTVLRNIITHLLLFKDLVCIGPKKISEHFLNYKLGFQENPILSKFYCYIVKIAYTYDIYIETLQVYNNNRAIFSQISTPKAYKTLNYLMEIFSTIEAIQKQQKAYAKSITTNSEIKPASPIIIYNRIRMCLIADLILYFTYIKQAILTAPLRSQQLEIEQVSLVEQFSKVSVQFKRVLYESNVENSYFSTADQKSIIKTKREIQKNILANQQVGILTSRDPNLTHIPQKRKCQFSFGNFTSRQI